MGEISHKREEGERKIHEHNRKYDCGNRGIYKKVPNYNSNNFTKGGTFIWKGRRVGGSGIKEEYDR